MTDMAEGRNSVEKRLEGVESGLKQVRTEVGGLRTEVGGLRSEVGGLRSEVGGLRSEVGGLRTETHSLRVLCEKNADDIKKVAEVQLHHGRKLEEIANALKPLAELHEFIKVVAPEHERRIKALEDHTGLRK